MNRLTMLATPDGRWVLDDSAEFLSALGDPNPDYDAAAFAVKNLGFIKFQVLGGSLVEIELHPRNVELPPLLAVQQQLLSSRATLFRVKYFEQAWHSEITSSKEGAVSRLSELCAPAFAPRPSQRFVAEPCDYSDLLAAEASPLRLMAQKWRMSFGHFSPSIISFAIEHQLLSRIMIFGVKPRRAEPVFRFIGDGFKWLATEYQFYGIGERIENQPDKEFGGWVAEFYKAVASTSQPRYDHVTAAIETWPGYPKPYLTRYERLLLPWKTSTDEVFVSMMSRKLRAEDSVEVDGSEAGKRLVSTSLKSS
ncbi:MAG: hypothetical protein ACREE9_10050 [Stellaceae bacterium]